MKLLSLRSAAAIAVASSLILSRASAATLTVSPSAVDNTYNGTITLNLTGLTNHEPVTMQTYLDLNNNAALDGGDLLIDVFDLVESGVTTIGGITNLNVPFDGNSATDTISATLSFAPSIERTVGRKIYRASSPSGRFAPVTGTLTMTNAALSQAVTGTAYANGVPAAGAMVVALGYPNFNFAGAVLTDGSGNYFFKLPTGTYALMPARPGAYTDQSIVPIIVLTSGATVTNDVYLTNGPATISGQVYDAVSSNALAGVFLQFESDNLFGIAFSDASGNFVAGVSSNNWKIKLDGDRISRRGYVRAQGSVAQANTFAGSVSGVNVPLLHGNAMFYGRFTDNSGTPFANISIGANDSGPGSQFESQGFTDANGYYSVVTFVNTNMFPSSGVWRVSPSGDNNSLFDSYVTSQSNDVGMTNNQAIRQDFVAIPATTQLSGQLMNNHGDPVSGVSIGANAVIGGTNFSTRYVQTDDQGYYSFAIANGQWAVFPNCCGNEGLDSQGYYDPFQHVVTIPPANPEVNITVYPIGTPFLSYPQRYGNQFGFNLNGSAGNNYTVQATTNLAGTNWFTVLVVSNMPGGSYWVSDNNATNKQRFYRVRLGP